MAQSTAPRLGRWLEAWSSRVEEVFRADLLAHVQYGRGLGSGVRLVNLGMRVNLTWL